MMKKPMSSRAARSSAAAASSAPGAPSKHGPRSITGMTSVGRSCRGDVTANARLPRLQRNRQQRVEAAAVADDDALAKAQGAAVVDQKVEIAAGGEEIHRAVAHDADHEERRLGAHGALDFTEDRRQADEVTIGLTLVDVRPAQRRDPVAEHARRVGVDDARLEPPPVVVGGRDLVDARLGEEAGPRLEAVVVDRARVVGVERGHERQQVRGRQVPRCHLSSPRSEEHTSELQSLAYLVCRLLLEKKNNYIIYY